MSVEINPIEINWLSDRPSKIDNNVNKVENTSSFKNVFKDAISDVKTSEAELQKQQYLLATGQIDNPHAVPIAAAKAQLSIDMLVQLRNKSIEAYNELMRINL